MKIAVIADDLTGANANGALLTEKGFASATSLGLETWDRPTFSGYTAVTISTDSRLLSKQDAYDEVYRTAKTIVSPETILVAKRIDSTLRGNVGAEIEAAIQAVDDINREHAAGGTPVKPATAVVVPAFPASGRIAAGGYLLVHGVPLQHSPIANDSATPIHETSVLKIIRQQTALPTGYIPLETILAGKNAVRDSIDTLHNQGMRIIVCDAVTDDNIRTIAQSLAQIGFPVLSVDPGPFTAELAATLVHTPKTEFENRVFCAIGSTTELTRGQVEFLRVTHPAHICPVCVKSFLQSEETRQREIERVLEELLQAPPQTTVLGICTAPAEEDIFSLEDMANEMGLLPKEVSVRITSSISDIVKRVLALPQLHIGGLFASGGEVTVNAIRELGAKGFVVRDEVLPLAVYGRLIGGDYPDLPMVTKGGFVGNQEALVTCVAYLFTKISTKTRN